MSQTPDYTWTYDSSDFQTNVGFESYPASNHNFDQDERADEHIHVNMTAADFSVWPYYSFGLDVSVGSDQYSPLMDGNYITYQDSLHIIMPEGYSLRYHPTYGYNYLQIMKEDPVGSGTFTPLPTWIRVNTNQNTTWETICFARGTLIRCADGQDRPVEALRIGDEITTRDSGVQRIRWVGSSVQTCETLDQFPNRRPVRFKAGSVIENTEDLVVSPQHRVHITGALAELLGHDPVVGALVAAKSLVNDRDIVIDHSLGSVEYFHVLFDKHELIFSNGAWTESFRPGAYSMSSIDKVAQAEVYTIFPELDSDSADYGSYARPFVRPGQVRRIMRNRNVENDELGGSV